MTWLERLGCAVLLLFVFGVLVLLMEHMSPEYRDCIASFYPQSYCNSQELIRNLEK